MIGVFGIGVDLVGILGGRMASAERASGCPLPSRLGGLGAS